MKNFFKSVAIAAALFATCGAFAQTDPSKETVIVEPFTCTQKDYNSAKENIRGAVMSGFSNMGRFHVVDALSDARLSSLFQNRKYEDVVTDQNWMTESTTVYKSLNAKKMLKGQLEMVKEYTKVNEEGKKYYYIDTNFTLQVFSITDGTMTGSDSFSYHELSSVSYSDAFKTTLRKIEKDMNKFCNDFFKIESYVLDLGNADKKGNTIDLWVSGGKNVGIQKGTVFTVKVEKKIGPKTTRTDIGKVVAEEVTDDMTRCKIIKKDEGAVISAAFKEGKTLYVELDHKRGEALGGALRSLF